MRLQENVNKRALFYKLLIELQHLTVDSELMGVHAIIFSLLADGWKYLLSIKQIQLLKSSLSNSHS